MDRWHLHQRHIAKHLGHADGARLRRPGLAHGLRELATEVGRRPGAWLARQFARRPAKAGQPPVP